MFVCIEMWQQTRQKKRQQNKKVYTQSRHTVQSIWATEKEREKERDYHSANGTSLGDGGGGGGGREHKVQQQRQKKSKKG